MVCRLCGSKNSETARFCDQCAAPLTVLCAACGESNRSSVKFCSACSASLDGPPTDAEASPVKSPALVAAAETPIHEAERRRLTVLFCDLVDSTEIAAAFDPEDWGEILTEYHNRATATVERFGGHVALYLGDGLLAFFGYPQAHEDDPQRAVLAGLALVGAIEELNAESSRLAGLKLAVRVGIHCGPVVVAGGSRRRANVFGTVPNVASRVQAAAASNTVVITEAVHQVVSGVFAVEDGGTRALKGIETPVQLYRVLRPSGLRGRLAISAGSGLTPFVGRQDELRLLLDRWDRAREGAGQMVVIIGEPGIGKSRLLRRFRDQIAGSTHFWVDSAAASLHQNTPFYAIEDALRQSLGPHEHTPSERLAGYEAAVELAGLNLAEAMPLLAPLMDLIDVSKYPPPQLEPEQRRKRLLATITAWVLGTARLQPLVIACEDLHWSDPSTLEVIQLLAQQGGSVPMLLICTGRPEFHPPWPSRPHHTEMTLNRLNLDGAREMVKHLAQLAPAAAEAVAERSGGVPLFVEELTRSIVESGNAEAAIHEIPATLHDSLMARLDRLGEAREVAQVASVIGHEFSWKVLRAVGDVAEKKLANSLKTLVDAQLLVERGVPPEASYTFRHALIGDTAYQSLLRSKRQQYHRRIAEFLALSPADSLDARPQLLAHHYTEAGLIELAIPHWQMAGQLAIQRSANAEAINHLTRGLGLLKTLPVTPESFQQELKLQLTLGTPLIATKGFAAPETGAAYARARELCSQAGEVPQLFPVFWGLWMFYTARNEHTVAREMAEQCLRLARSANDPALLIQAHHIYGVGLIGSGEHDLALEHLNMVSAIYNPQEHGTQAYLYGHDPAAVSVVHAAWALWFLGYPDQAQRKCHEGFALAQKLNHPYTTATAAAFASWLSCFCGDDRAVEELASTTITISNERGFSFYRAWGMIMHGWAMAQQNQITAGIAEMNKGLSEYRATGAQTLLIAFLNLLAEAYGKAGQIEDGLSAVAEAQSVFDNCSGSESWWLPELYRLKGELILKAPGAPSLAREAEDEAEGCFRRALAVAQRQQAKSLELRAVTSLSGLWFRQSKGHEASRALEKALGSFTEGFDTPDYVKARGLLSKL